MSFLIDPPLLFLNGEAYARLAPESAQRGGSARVAAAATVGVFWLVGVATYRSHRLTRPLWRAFRARDGRDFMVNSGVLRIDTRRAGAGTHLAAAAIFATYPLWLVLGYRRGRRAAAR